MKTFSALLALCAGNSQSPAQRPVTQNFDAFFDLRIEKNGWVSNRGAGDLGRHCAHYDVIVMSRWIHLSVCRTDWYYSDQHFVIISRCYKEHFSANELLKKRRYSKEYFCIINTQTKSPHDVMMLLSMFCRVASPAMGQTYDCFGASYASLKDRGARMAWFTKKYYYNYSTTEACAYFMGYIVW